MVQTIDPNKLTCRSAISICLKRTVYHFGHKLFYYSIENTFFYHHLPFTNQRYSSYIRHPREERQNNGNNIRRESSKIISCLVSAWLHGKGDDINTMREQIRSFSFKWKCLIVIIDRKIFKFRSKHSRGKEKPHR